MVLEHMGDRVGNTSTMETVEAKCVRRVDELVGLGALQFPAVVRIRLLSG
jgi:hypothetical protein